MSARRVSVRIARGNHLKLNKVWRRLTVELDVYRFDIFEKMRRHVLRKFDRHGIPELV